MITGDAIRRHREAAGVTMGALAEKLGVTRQYVSLVEHRLTVTPEATERLLTGIESIAAGRDGRKARQIVVVAVSAPPVRVYIGDEEWRP